MALPPLLLLRPPPPPPPPPPRRNYPSLPASTTRRSASAAALLLLAASSSSPPRPARAADPGGEDLDEPRVVLLLEEASPSLVSIKDLVVAQPKGRVAGGGARPEGEEEEEEGGAMMEGTGSGFVWDSSGHIVTNYHVVAKFAENGTGSHRCKVFLEDSSGSSYSKEGRLIGSCGGYQPGYLRPNTAI